MFAKIRVCLQPDLHNNGPTQGRGGGGLDKKKQRSTNSLRGLPVGGRLSQDEARKTSGYRGALLKTHTNVLCSTDGAFWCLSL